MLRNIIVVGTKMMTDKVILVVIIEVFLLHADSVNLSDIELVLSVEF